jgi:hypothetical protein
VRVVQLALDESDQPGAVLPVQSFDLGGHHSPYVPAHPVARNDEDVSGRWCRRRCCRC